MRSQQLLVVLLMLSLLLFCGCDKKKEQAAELEKELMGQEGTTDSAAVETQPAETLPSEREAAKPDAVPKEKTTAGSISFDSPNGFSVQVAACESREYAEYLMRRYAKRGYQPFLSQTVFNGQTFYRVRIGDVPTRQEAEGLRTELTDKYSIVGAWIGVPK